MELIIDFWRTHGRTEEDIQRSMDLLRINVPHLFNETQGEELTQAETEHLAQFLEALENDTAAVRILGLEVLANERDKHALS